MSLVVLPQHLKEKLLSAAKKAISVFITKSMSEQRHIYQDWEVGFRLLNYQAIHIYQRIPLLMCLFKDSVTAIDVTEDGSYVLATCKTYLLLICTELRDSNTTGFNKAMGEQKVRSLR